MATRPAWTKAGAVLRMTYGKLAHRDALNSLYRKLNDLDDDRLLAAIERHLDDDTRESSGSLVGNWFPKPAQIRFHANTLQVEEAKARRLELEIRAERIQAEAAARVVEFPAEETSACRECHDGGMASYWIPNDLSHPANKYRVYEKGEHSELSEAMKTVLQRYSAVCDCEAGQLRRAQNPTGHMPISVNGRERRAYITVEEVRKMAHRRRKKEDTGYGVGAESGT